MLASLRSLGYSFEAAVADIVDNSVAAEATRVDLQFRTKVKTYLAIVDDGQGMSGDALIEAMRHGGMGPGAARHETDLGRFGLGLKTASLSQCRRLTVVSLRNGQFCGARWDLDQVERESDWVLDYLDESEAQRIPHADTLPRAGHGTVVLWEDFDRATAGESSAEKAIGDSVDHAASHLSLAFHRFLAKEAGVPPLEIFVNDRELHPLDPFLSAHPSTQVLPVETVRADDALILIRPFILPHISKMSSADLALAGGEDGLRRNQGFYVYRNHRLITYGTWFRLLRQEELTKLARILVDIPNSLDHLWALDVKKSMAHPPEIVRVALRRVIERIAATSRRVYQFRGRRSSSGDITHVWDRMMVRDGISYRINREHPLVDAVKASSEDAGIPLEELLRSLEMSLPTHALYADMAADRNVQPPEPDDQVEAILRDLAERIVNSIGHDSSAVVRLLDGLEKIEPFSAHPQVTRRMVEEMRSGR